jgi:hypothetical protein
MMRGVRKHKTMEEWAHSAPAGHSSGGGRKLESWRDTKTGLGQIDVFLHCATLPEEVWRHPIPTIIAVEDKKTREKKLHVWSRDYTCHEIDSTLSHRFREEKGNPLSAREKPYERCGVCKFTEHVWLECWRWLETHAWDPKGGQWVENKKGGGKGIDPCSVALSFVSQADPKENTDIRAAHLCGLSRMDEKNLPDDLLAAFKKNDVRRDFAFKEDIRAQAKSIMSVVDANHPEHGVRIAEERGSLGEAVKEVIVTTIESLGIDIQKKPYRVRWKYDKSNGFDAYEAVAVFVDAETKKPLVMTDRIRNLITDPASAPDLSDIERPFNQQTMRAVFEKHCQLKNVPWDAIFPSRQQEAAWKAEDEEAARQEGGSLPSAEEPTSTSSHVEHDGTDEAPADEEDGIERDADGIELVQCAKEEGGCGKAMRITDPICPHCKKVWEVVEEQAAAPPPEPSKPKMRSRADAKKEAAQKGIREVPAPKHATPSQDEDSDVPF